METFFINLGLSYTWSKLLPYLLMTILGIAIGIYVFRKGKTTLMKIAAFVIMIVPFGIYFAVNPIYQGDFTNESRIVNRTADMDELTGEKLVMIAMPGCPYCMQAIDLLKALKKQHPEVQIEFIVTSSEPANLEPYTKKINGAFPSRAATNPEAMAKLAEGRFPSFVLVDEEDPFEVWNNNTFGVCALDEVVDSFD